MALSGLSISTLKALARTHGVSLQGCLEKGHIVDALKAAGVEGEGGPSSDSKASESTPAAKCAKTEERPPEVIEVLEVTGANAENSSVVNGMYVPVPSENQNGRAIWRKQGKTVVWLRYVVFENRNQWIISSTAGKEANDASGWCGCIEQDLLHPDVARSWQVWNGTLWRHQPVRVVRKKLSPDSVKAAEERAAAAEKAAEEKAAAAEKAAEIAAAKAAAKVADGASTASAGNQEEKAEEAAPEKLADPKDRGAIKARLFTLWDKDNDGKLTSEELLALGRATGFDGPESVWRTEYGKLCEDRKVPPGEGMPKDLVMTLLDDESEDGLFLPTEELWELLPEVIRAKSMDRGRVKMRLFELWDQDQDGILKRDEMKRCATDLGFDGSEEDWDAEFSRMCFERGTRQAGMNENDLMAILEDESDRGLYLATEDLREIMIALEAAVARGEILVQPRKAPEPKAADVEKAAGAAPSQAAPGLGLFAGRKFQICDAEGRVQTAVILQIGQICGFVGMGSTYVGKFAEECSKRGCVVPKEGLAPEVARAYGFHVKSELQKGNWPKSPYAMKLPVGEGPAAVEKAAASAPPWLPPGSTLPAAGPGVDLSGVSASGGSLSAIDSMMTAAGESKLNVMDQAKMPKAPLDLRFGAWAARPLWGPGSRPIRPMWGGGMLCFNGVRLPQRNMVRAPTLLPGFAHAAAGPPQKRPATPYIPAQPVAKKPRLEPKAIVTTPAKATPLPLKRVQPKPVLKPAAAKPAATAVPKPAASAGQKVVVAGSRVATCQVCEKTPAEPAAVFCKECDAHLCSKCNDEAHPTKFLQKHTREAAKPLPPKAAAGPAAAPAKPGPATPGAAKSVPPPSKPGGTAPNGKAAAPGVAKAEPDAAAAKAVLPIPGRERKIDQGKDPWDILVPGSKWQLLTSVALWRNEWGAEKLGALTPVNQWGIATSIEIDMWGATGKRVKVRGSSRGKPVVGWMEYASIVNKVSGEMMLSPGAAK